MRTLLGAVTVLGVALAAAGCPQRQGRQAAAVAPPLAQRSQVAVVDLTRVAKEIGAEYQYLTGYMAAKQDGMESVESVRAKAEQALEGLRRDLANEPTAAGQAAARRRIAKVEGELIAAKLNQQAELEKYNRRMQREFRFALRPALAKICREHGRRIIMLAGPDVLYSASTLDLTDALLKELRADPIDLAPAAGRP